MLVQVIFSSRCGTSVYEQFMGRPEWHSLVRKKLYISEIEIDMLLLVVGI